MDVPVVTADYSGQFQDLLAGCVPGWHGQAVSVVVGSRQRGRESERALFEALPQQGFHGREIIGICR